jgi:hypothetical protein
MYFSLRWVEERLLCAYSTLFSPTKVKVHGVLYHTSKYLDMSLLYKYIQ